MNNIKLIAVAILISISSCSKHTYEKVVVVKDCTGKYLRYSGKDYRVCNPDKIEAFNNGASIRASYRKIDECRGPEAHSIVCEMVHKYESWIEILSVK